MEKLLPILYETNEFSGITESFAQGAREQYIYGLSGSQKTFVMAALNKKIEKPMLIITSDQNQAERIQKDLSFLLPGREIGIFPAYDVMAFDVYSQSREVATERLSLLNRIVKEEIDIVIAPIKAILRRLISPEDYYSSFFSIKSQEEYDLERLIHQLVVLGYERVMMVEHPGQFSVRGGILDVYIDGTDNPHRIEFFGNEVDTIRIFDPVSQRSVQDTECIQVTPALELILHPDSQKDTIDKLRQSLTLQLKKVKEISQKNRLRGKIESIIEEISNLNMSQVNPTILPFITQEKHTILSFMPCDTIIMLDEPSRLQETAVSWETLMKESFSNSLEGCTILPEQLETFISWNQMIERMKSFQIILWSSLLRQTAPFKPDRLHNISARPLYPYLGSVETLLSEMKSFRRNRNRIVIITSSEERAEKLLMILRDYNFDCSYQKDIQGVPTDEECVVTIGELESGFEFSLLKLAVVVDDAITGKRRKHRKTRIKGGSQGITWSELKENEYVVHVNHGIGRFSGVTALEIEGIKKDFLLIQYLADDKVYVPVDQMDLVQRYVGPDGHQPKLSRLGGAEWQKAKLNTRAAVAEMAEELLKLYAERESVRGYHFSQDTVWQKEFEEKFEYNETEDQLNAVIDVKRDMESEKPMDRLLCGDVGYGKTEVAIRGAFKSAIEGKQVGVLVPTTVLAQQHFNTFHSRFQGYPIKIEMMSRFVSEAKQKEVIAGLKSGDVDIVIGTHRLLQKDILFKDLGLLIVDEEQRFGVRHKERIKEIRSNVDVLTLTATPIPRTLHMAISGIRDMSMIMEPPEDRLPVQTFVLEEQDALIREAVLLEINRGGQVYYIHNRVKTIDRAARKLQKLIPEANIGVGHGQMREEELEKVMIDFIDKEFDILVCSTIVETGMDIPNVNTIIVEDADHFGLSQLYQLRGRVGRSHRQGYCYLLFKRNKVLTEIADRRLEAIKEFTEFGSGFKIAMKDLEIRGAGNLLGAEQHGHLSVVGFELYCRLLEEAVIEAKGNRIIPAEEPLIDVKIDAFLSNDYISDNQQKIEIYKKIASSRTEEEIRDIIDEMVDRFGDPPIEAQQLLDIIRLKIVARDIHIHSINHIQDVINIRFSSVSLFNQEAVVKGISKYNQRLSMSAQSKPLLCVSVEGLKQKEIINMLQHILNVFKESVQV